MIGLLKKNFYAERTYTIFFIVCSLLYVGMYLFIKEIIFLYDKYELWREKMKVKKVISPKTSAYQSIKKSMSNQKEICICNNLDACGCTGNGNC